MGAGRIGCQQGKGQRPNQNDDHAFSHAVYLPPEQRVGLGCLALKKALLPCSANPSIRFPFALL
jgi:hypothetical protein